MTKDIYQTIKIIIADDHAMLRLGFQNMFRKQPEIEFVAEAENGRELVQLTEKHKPDLVFTDISMPVMDGIEATRKIHKQYPDIGIIALTTYDSDDLIIKMLDAGAKGYLLKNASRKEVLEAIHCVYEHGTYYCRRTSEKLSKILSAGKYNTKKEVKFTEREKQVICLICKEYSNKEIAASLDLSIRTVEGHRQRIQSKMEVQSTAGLVVYAIEKGLYIKGRN